MKCFDGWRESLISCHGRRIRESRLTILDRPKDSFRGDYLGKNDAVFVEWFDKVEWQGRPIRSLLSQTTRDEVFRCAPDGLMKRALEITERHLVTGLSEDDNGHESMSLRVVCSPIVSQRLG
jgi:hypothetical protein